MDHSGLSFEDVALKMHERAQQLNERLCTLKKINDDLIDRSKKVLEALEAFVGIATNKPKTCNVCYSRPRTHVFLPCGHGGFCLSCCERGHSRNRCFTCRARVDNVLKVYV